MRQLYLRLVVLSALCAVGTKANAEIIWRGDFQTGDRSQWTSTETVSTDRLQIVTDPVPNGYEYALQTIVRQGDTVFGGDRSELDFERDKPGEGDERYYHWKTYFPADFQSADYWQLFTQWHQYVSGGSPPLAFMAWGEKIQVGNDREEYPWSAPLVRGVWHDFVFHVVWSTDSSVGGIELWYDGEHALPMTHSATLFPDDTVYLKQGLYRKNVISWEQTIYHCGMTIGTQLSDVMTPVSETPDAGSTLPDAGHQQPDAGSSHASDAGTSAPTTDAGTAVEPGSGGEVIDEVPRSTQGCSSTSVPALALVATALWMAFGRGRKRRQS